MARLQVTLRTHVVVDVLQIEFQLFAIKYVLPLKASKQASLFDILHGAAKFAVTKDIVAFKLNFDDAHPFAFVDDESEGRRGSRNLVTFFFDCRVGMTVGSK